jgi:hypothetical protein
MGRTCESTFPRYVTLACLFFYYFQPFPRWALFPGDVLFGNSPVSLVFFNCPLCVLAGSVSAATVFYN